MGMGARPTSCLLVLALLIVPASALTGGSLDLSDSEKARARDTLRTLTRAVQQAAEGDPKRAVVKAAEAAADYWIQGFGADAPEWAKRIEFEWETKEDDKPEWSVLTVQPLFQSEDKQDTVFTQLRIAREFTFGSHRMTANAGLGYRRLVWDDQVLLGVNVFFDHELDNDHNRVGGGGEVRWSGFDLYLNYYEAVSSARSVAASITERALDGYDVELTSQIPYVPWARGRGRYFHFDSVAKANNIDGFSASLEIDLQQNLQFEVGFSDDDVTRDGVWFAQFRFRLGGGKGPVLTSTRWIDAEPFRRRDMSEHTLDKVRRDNTIVIERTTAAGTGGTTTVTISRGT